VLTSTKNAITEIVVLCVGILSEMQSETAFCST